MQAKGAKIVVADTSDQAALTAALKGASRPALSCVACASAINNLTCLVPLPVCDTSVTHL